MEQLKFGMISSPPFLYVTEGSLEGLILPYFEAITYNIIAKFNLTFFNTKFGSGCDQNGHCTGDLGDLQSGRIDYVSAYSLHYLASLPINFTISPIADEIGCYIIYKPKVIVALSSKSYFDLINQFQPIFWLILISLMILIILILKISKSGHLDSYWNYVGFGSSPNTNGQLLEDKLTSKIIRLTLIVTILLFGAIFAASLQTGLTSTINYIKFNSFDDIIEHKYSVVILDGVTCKSMFSKSTVKSVNYLASRAINYNVTNRTPMDIYKTMTLPLRVIIEEPLQYQGIKSLSCIMSPESGNLIYKSRKSMFNIISVNLYGKFLSQKVKSTIIKSSYSAFEMSAALNHKSLQFILSSIGFNIKPSQVCMNNQDDYQNQIIITSISTNYFKLPFIVCLTGQLIAMVIFMTSIYLK